MKAALTQARLKELLHYDPESGAITWASRPSSRVKVGMLAGKVHPTQGYRQVRADKSLYYAHRLAWLYMTGEWPAADVDHINHVRDDNRWSNLRGATRSQNIQYKSMQSNNTSGVKGVYFHAGKWAASIQYNGKNRHLGRFTDLADAKEFVELARDMCFGEFAFHG